MVSLHEILSEITGVNINSKKVEKLYHELITKYGPELKILHELPIRKIEGAGVRFLSEAIKRLRQEKVISTAGYDGVYGTIKLFNADELGDNKSQPRLI